MHLNLADNPPQRCHIIRSTVSSLNELDFSAHQNPCSVRQSSPRSSNVEYKRHILKYEDFMHEGNAQNDSIEAEDMDELEGTDPVQL